ncbi:glutathione S-transferase family protein [Sphingomonas morindae]|uniref:Glutathione S-transferase n=1 Tax=Sphingomonas morindae TaxID=1541170 RepID=A0ABY4X8V4_9SPHN|nr:glutathione S-transferase [Sphingomonas morindae]USI73352.1 glutathione S-transferase [Sphingomonas morindae]
MTYALWYWSEIPGRGEFVRLALEAGRIPYEDKALARDDVALMRDRGGRRPEPFAPPYLVAGDLVIAQVAAILLYLGESHGLAPADPRGRLLAHQIQLTIADCVTEAHDTHHPVAMGAYYEDQIAEAARRADDFRTERLPKFLGWFERMLARSDGPWLLGADWSYADLSLFQLLDGLRFAFPLRMERLAGGHPRLTALHAAVAALPVLQPYFKSGRRQPYGDGIFRHYPELDAA